MRWENEFENQWKPFLGLEGVRAGFRQMTIVTSSRDGSH